MPRNRRLIEASQTLCWWQTLRWCQTVRCVSAAALVTLVFSAMDAHAGAPPAAQPPTVIVEAVAKFDVNDTRTFSGRIEAVEKIEVVARTEGVITKRGFKEGAEVKKGQLLFEIDRRPYEIAVVEAEANLAGSKAGRDEAADQLARTQDLVQKQAAAETSLVSAKVKLAQALAKVAADEAEVEQAKLRLQYTQILAATDGRVGRATHDVGDLVTPASSPLATLVTQDPMYVTFAVPVSEVKSLLKPKGDGSFGAEVDLLLGDGSRYPHRGIIAFVDVSADALSDTVAVRATVPNPTRELLPQELVDAVIVDVTKTKSLAISQSAILLDQQGSYVLALNDQDMVRVQRVETGAQHGGMIYVKAGLSEGDRIIVRGHLKATPGVVVKPELQAQSNAQSVTSNTP